MEVITSMVEDLIHIRPATRQDAPLAGQLVHLSMGPSAGLFFANERRSIDESIAWLFEQDAGRFGHSLGNVAEWKGNAVGLLVSFRSADLMGLSLAAGWPMLRLLGARGIFRLMRTLAVTGLESEAGAGEYYVSNIAVLPEFQGRGIGSALLRYADHMARTRRLKKCSLIVSMQNDEARRLYERHGYREVRSIHYRTGDGVLDHTHMVKSLVQVQVRRSHR